MGRTHFFLIPGLPFEIDLLALARGFINQPVFSITNVVNGTTSTSSTGRGQKLVFTPSAKGLASFTFTVRDADGATMEKTVNILADAEVAAMTVGTVDLQASRKNNNEVDLKWTTEMENGSSHFEVQRSLTANGPFSMVGQQPTKAVQGYSDSRLDYVMTDTNNHAGPVWYRVNQKTIDGRSVYSTIRSVPGVKTAFRIWPVPSDGTFYVSVAGRTDNMSVRLLTVDGKQISARTLRPDQPEALTAPAVGNYIVQVIGGDGMVLFSEKVIRSR
jgi:hypothetical protein